MSAPCGCPLDWVVCFRVDCPRADIIRRDQQERINRAFTVLVDPDAIASDKQPNVKGDDR
jgi:hypothetical protein